MEKELQQQFDDEMGFEATPEVMAKSIELCVMYRIEDASDFVAEWMAFSISHLKGDEPTVDHLLEFERKVLQTKREKELAQLASRKKTKYPSAIANLTHLNAAASTAALEANPLAMYGVESDVMDDYMGETIDDDDGGVKAADTLECHTPKPKAKSTLARTPARHNDALLFSPASYSPISGAGTPRTHIHAAGSGKIVYTFGNPTLISTAQWNTVQQPKIHIKQLLMHNGESLSAAKSKYMFDNLREKSEIAGDRLFGIGKSLCLKVFGADAEDYQLSQVDVHSQDTTKTIGTICCDHDGPLNQSSTLLIGSDEMRCRTVRLNFAKAKSVGVFPGQIVIVSGINPKGDIFMVEEIYAERPLAAPEPPKFADQLSFVVAAGPYTHNDDLVYEPLHDLITYLKLNKPNVLILTGPFLEAEHTLIGELAETFESFFEKIIAGIVEAIGTSLTILIVTSHKDANADAVYPTIPINLKKKYPNVHMLPDPSMIDLNGIVIGMTSTDVVDHIINCELAISAGDKVKRVVNYLLHQGSFYPLNPPMENKMCFDSFLANKYANIEQVPNILILPSDQKCFIRVVSGCLAINPGRLTDANGGTFARFIITPPAPKDESNLFSFVGCQVRKV